MIGSKDTSDGDEIAALTFCAENEEAGAGVSVGTMEEAVLAARMSRWSTK